MIDPITASLIVVLVAGVAYFLGWHRGYTEAARAHQESLEDIRLMIERSQS